MIETPRPPMMPVWDLALVLSVLSGPAFEPIHSSKLKVLSFKMAILLALACGKRVSDLQARMTASQFRSSKQLFVCFAGAKKGSPLSKQMLSHWIVEAIYLSYVFQRTRLPSGNTCPLH